MNKGDCAQAFGAEVKGKKVGTIADFACYSFHAQKNFTTLGEGGAIYVKDSKLFKNVKGIRHNGHTNYENRNQAKIMRNDSKYDFLYIFNPIILDSAQKCLFF